LADDRIGPIALIRVERPKVEKGRTAEISEQSAVTDSREVVRPLKDLLWRALGEAHRHIW
jgi:hypothetical protein